MNEKLYLTFRSLRHRNYRLFISGQCISLIGTWIQQVAMSWLIYSLTKSPLIMGLVMFAGAAPSLLMSPYAGVLIDRINKHKFLILLQALFMLETLAIALLTILKIINVSEIVILTIIMGLTNAFDMPLRQAFVVELIEDSDDLNNAISLNSSSFNLARLVGPAIAGVLISIVGEGVCFLLNSLSYIAVIIALLAMRLASHSPKKTKDKNAFAEFKEGIRYVSKSKAMTTILIYLSVISLIGMAYPVLMPIFADEILHGGAETLGFLMSASGIGALIGALCLAGKKSVKGLEKWIGIASLIFGVGLVGLSLESRTLISLILLFISGFGMVIVIASCNTLLQHLVDNDKRGRVMSLYTMAFMGTAPFGSLCGGSIAQKIGVPYTFFLIGIIIIISALIFTTKQKYFELSI